MILLETDWDEWLKSVLSAPAYENYINPPSWEDRMCYDPQWPQLIDSPFNHEYCVIEVKK